MSLDLAHIINLRSVGGIERDYTSFIAYGRDGDEVRHHTIAKSREVAKPLRRQVAALSTSLRRLDTAWGVRIPGWPRGLREGHLNRMLARIRPDAVVLWSNPSIASAVSGRFPVVYYEHGAAWFRRDPAKARAALAGVNGVICNSRASKRMVELRWGLGSDRIQVCLNAVRPDCLPHAASGRSLPSHRPLRLGVAGRFQAVKGFALAIMALRPLLDAGIEVELHLAGEGREGTRLRALSKKLGVQGAVRFLGFVDEMSEFFEGIDLFLCPSLREPFGLVCAESLAHGVPVVATAVDGLPEVVEHGVTGLCIEPTLGTDHYAELGGGTDGLPKFVYDPGSDSLRAPRAIEPPALADAARFLVEDRTRYHNMSLAGISAVRERFDYGAHARALLASIETIIRMS